MFKKKDTVHEAFSPFEVNLLSSRITAYRCKILKIIIQEHDLHRIYEVKWYSNRIIPV